MSKIVISYVSDIKKTTYECLKVYNAVALIDKNRKIIIKPNLVNSTKASNGATTHPEVVEGIIEYLLDNGRNNIEILESSWIGGNVTEAYKVCGYESIKKKYNIPLLNALNEGFKSVTYNGIKMNVSAKVTDDVFLVNVPVLKAHCQTQITCCIKNLKGLVTNNDKRNFHALGLHEPIAALGAVIKTGLNVIDGICGDLTFEEGGNPVETNMIIMGEDPLLLDTYAAEFMGYDPNAIKYLELAKIYGVGEFYSKNTEIYINGDKKPPISMKPSRVAAGLSKYINEKEACSACYSALIHALYKADKGAISKYEKSKIAIGQGFKGVKCSGMGFGSCTTGFSDCVKGCPPKALDLLKLLK